MARPLSSEDLPDPFRDMGIDTTSRRLIHPGTIDALKSRGLHLQGELGAGATSLAYEVRQGEYKVKQVVKICIRPEEPQVRALFLRELEILRENYPSRVLPMLHDYHAGTSAAPSGAPGCQPFLVMEFIEGKTLAGEQHEIASRPLLRRVVRAVGLARAVQALHEVGVIHGDISLRNVMIEQNDRGIRLIDVGQGGRLEGTFRSINSVSKKFGTEGCSSFDHLNGRCKTSYYTDLRQTAAIVFHALTGELPESIPEAQGQAGWRHVLKQHGVPRSLRAIVLKGLRDPSSSAILSLDQKGVAMDPRLYTTMQEFTLALEHWQVSWQTRWRRWGQGMLVGGLLAVAGWLWWSGRNQQYVVTDQQLRQLRKEVREQDQSGHPAIRALLSQADALQSAGVEALGRGAVLRAGELQGDQREVLRRALRTVGDLQRLAPLRAKLSSVLEQTPWIESAPTIAGGVRQMRGLNERIASLFEQGETGEAVNKLAEYLERLAQTTRENTAARPAWDARLAWERLRGALPANLASEPTLRPSLEQAVQAEGAWTSGDWETARLTFGQAQQGTRGWLTSWGQAHPGERGVAELLLKSDAELVAQLNDDLELFRKTANEQQGELAKLRVQITETAGRLLETQRKLEEETAALGKEREVVRQLRDEVRTTGEQLEMTRSEREALTTAKQEVAADLARTSGVLAIVKQERDNVTAKSTQQEEDLRRLREELDEKTRWATEAECSQRDWQAYAEESAKRLQELQVIPPPAPSPLPVAGGRLPSRADSAVKIQAGERLMIEHRGVQYAFRWCPPGKFLMGTPQGEQGRDIDENQVDVQLTQGFWMLETEVTQGMWVSVMGGPTAKGWSAEYGLGETLPVYNVTWDEARSFAEQLQWQLRRAKLVPLWWNIRLPTEAQWEYACRAGTTSRYCFGDDGSKLGDYAWFKGNSDSRNQPVGTKRDNPWGLRDVHGSVWEWCMDPYQNHLPGGTDPLVTSGGYNRVLRGGSSWGFPEDVRSGFRFGGYPGLSVNYLGFRFLAVPEDN